MKTYYIGKSKNTVFLRINGNLEYIDGGKGIKILTFFLYSLYSFKFPYLLLLEFSKRLIPDTNNNNIVIVNGLNIDIYMIGVNILEDDIKIPHHNIISPK